MWLLTRDRGHPWTAPPARAIHYFIGHRIADWHNGRRDGRLGLPVVPARILELGRASDVIGDAQELDDGVGALKLKELRHRYRGAMEGELTRFLRFRDGMSPRISEAEERLTAAADRLAELRALRDEARRPSPEAELARRRLADHRRRLQDIEQRYAAAEEDRSRARQAVETLERTTSCRWDLARVRARRLHEHAHRRANVYWRQLVRHHPQGDLLNGLLATVGPDLPAWAMADAPVSLTRPESEHDVDQRDADHATRSHPFDEQDEQGGRRDRLVASPTTAPNSGA
jgi:ABC transport system ATP-binding/permease protein